MDLSALEACETRLRLGSTEAVDLPSLKGRSPEEQVAVLRVLRALHLRGDTIGVPAERETGRLPVEVRLELYTLQLALDPTAFDLEDPLAAEALLRMRARDVRPEAVAALAERGIEHGGQHLGQEVCEVLRGMLDDRNDEWVRTCGRSLAYMRDPGSVRAFVGLLDHRSVPVRRMAAEALKLQPEEAEREVRRALRRARPDRRPALHRVLSTLTSGAQRATNAAEAG